MHSIIKYNPTQTKPNQSNPIQSKPNQTKPIQSNPIQSKPIQSNPIQSKPNQTKPIQSNPIQSNPTQPNNFLLRRGNKGFTLVELIVVIAILVMLSSLTFVKLTQWLGKSRDAARLTDLATMSKSLELYYVEKGEYPKPDRYVEVRYSGETLTYQGKFGGGVVEELQNISKVPRDPKDKKEYTYVVNEGQDKYELLAMMEGRVEIGMMDRVYAVNGYKKRIPKVRGEKVGVILRAEDNMPLEEIESGEKELKGDDTGYKVILDNQEIEELKGNDIISVYKGSCKVLLDQDPNLVGKDGIYEIYVKSGTNYTKIKVYCDMTFAGLTDFLMGEGDFKDGKGISTEMGSNPINEIVKIFTPVPYGYAVHQYGSKYAEYEIHLPFDKKKFCVQGKVFRMSAWVADTTGAIFHHRFWDESGNPFYLNNNSFPRGKIVQVKKAGGKKWELQVVEGILQKNVKNFSWYIGRSAEDPKDLYFTSVKVSCLDR